MLRAPIFLVRSWLALVGTLCVPLICLAQAQSAIEPGEYYATGGSSGTLKIGRSSTGLLTFEIESVGANGHTCDLRGTLQNGTPILENNDKDKPCVIEFDAQGGQIEVIQKSNCWIYCGARGYFDYVYMRVPKGCSVTEVAATRSRFQQLYNRKAFKAARETIEPLLGSCSSTLDRHSEASIRNDLAVTLYRLGDLSACLETLKPLSSAVAQAETATAAGEIWPTGEPIAAIGWEPIIKATRFNIRLCERRLKK